MLEMGDLCAWCGENTAFGSGKFVNRIPVITNLEMTAWAEDPKYLHLDDMTEVECYGCEACYMEDED